MSHNRRPSDPEKFIRDIEANQKNILWPDSLMNGRRADELLFKGSPTATRVSAKTLHPHFNLVLIEQSSFVNFPPSSLDPRAYID